MRNGKNMCLFEEWNRMVGKYCRTFRESDPALVQDLEDPFGEFGLAAPMALLPNW